MRANQGEVRFRVVDAAGAPFLGRVTRRAGRREFPTVRTLVARRAGAELHATKGAGLVTFLALHFAMRAGQLEASARMVELAARLLERNFRRVTARAVGSERALVHIGMARAAHGARLDKRSGLVAGRAVRRRLRMLAVERESRFSRMIEGPRVHVTQLGVDARVLDVAGHALFRGPMDARSPRDAIRDRLVTAQAARRRHSPSGFVAPLTVRAAFERTMGPGERAWRQELTELARTSSRHDTDRDRSHDQRPDGNRPPRSRGSNAVSP